MAGGLGYRCRMVSTGEQSAFIEGDVDPQGSLVFRSLRCRNFRLFYVGQGISLIGTWMQMIAGGWLAYDLTAGMPQQARAFWLGVVAFAGRIPTFILAPLAGVLVDRWDRRSVVVVTQLLAMLQAGVLAALTLGHWITLGQLTLLSFVLGVINALDVPARQSFMIEMVGHKEDLTNAIALNSSLVNGARIIGPALAGLLLKALGAGACFLLNAVSYVAVLTALFSMNLRPATYRKATGRIGQQLREGVRYTWRCAPIRDVLLLLALVSLTGASYTVLLPVFAQHVLGQGSGLYGLLFASAGVGALAGAIALARRRSTRGLGLWIALAPAIFGAGLIGLALSRSIALSLAVMPVIGFGMLVQMAASNTLLQTLVEDHMRGRVMAFYSMAFMGMVPLGSLLAGAMARLMGAPATVAINGLCCMLGAVAFLSRLPARQRRMYPRTEP